MDPDLKECNTFTEYGFHTMLFKNLSRYLPAKHLNKLFPPKIETLLLRISESINIYIEGMDCNSILETNTAEILIIAARSNTSTIPAFTFTGGFNKKINIFPGTAFNVADSIEVFSLKTTLLLVLIQMMNNYENATIFII